MKEQFVTYEIALKLKELGFNEECLAIYINLTLKPVIQKPISGEFNYKFKSVRNSVIVNSENCSAPLWQQVIDWLREVHNIEVMIKSWKQGNNVFTYSLNKIFEPSCYYTQINFNTYEYAKEQAILKALELIK